MLPPTSRSCPVGQVEMAEQELEGGYEQLENETNRLKAVLAKKFIASSRAGILQALPSVNREVTSARGQSCTSELNYLPSLIRLGVSYCISNTTQLCFWGKLALHFN